ncbi:MAG TPA: hypothetical protein ENJ82_15295 [Bacteroidetes bacterium]|nr:hypothetical protein [Bacteroidota bacterium]
MKKIILSILLLGGIYGISLAQSANVNAKVEEVLSIIEEHTPILEEFKTTLGEHKIHLEERIIVLKYHKGNKEVTEASGLVVNTIETYYQAVTEKVQQYEAVWFEQTRNIIAIYSRYGALSEATGGGHNDLQDFVDQHSRYLDMLDNIKSDLIAVYTDLSFIKNNI